MIRVAEVDRLFKETIITGNERKFDLHALQRSDASAEEDRGGGEGVFSPFFFSAQESREAVARFGRTQAGNPFPA